MLLVHHWGWNWEQHWGWNLGGHLALQMAWLMVPLMG